VIDLHLHTTASDGRSTPEALVAEASAAGIRTLSVTDHDTVAAVAAVVAAAGASGLAAIAGIEITAVHHGRDVHMLGYFIDPASASLAAFLRAQRDDRRRRLLAMAGRLEALGAPVDLAVVTGVTDESGRSIGRPHLAAALVARGHAVDLPDAFDKYLADGRPAYVERIGSAPADVVRRIHEAGGVASLAHPGKTKVDALIPELAKAGLDAIELFHPDHSSADVARYTDLARRHGLVVTGGSDYHGPLTGRERVLGRVTLPERAFLALAERAGQPRV
jgi:3',5'-nucleoside bisphosphate phosphatase